MHIIENIPVTFDREHLIKKLRLKYAEHLLLLDQCIEKARSLVKPKALVTTAYVDAHLENAVKIAGSLFESKVMAKNLEKVERVFPFVLTLGEDLEKEGASNENIMAQFILDELGNMGLLSAYKGVSAFLEKTYGVKKLSAMTPGSLEDWPIAEQPRLFALLGDTKNTIGVTLTMSFIMIPKKSTSGILFPSDAAYANCMLCPKKNCPQRQAAFSEKMAKEYGVFEH